MNESIKSLSQEMANFNESMGTNALVDYLATSLLRIGKELNQGNISINFDNDIKVIVDLEGIHKLQDV
jgi:hypothetical protein